MELKHLYNELNDNFSKNVVDLFKTMFLGSKFAEKMQLKRNKLKCVVNHGIAPYVIRTLKKPSHRHCLVCCII